MPNSPIDECIQSRVGVAFPGAMVAVRLGNRLVTLRAFGNSHIHPEPVPVRADAIFELASMTKPLSTGLLILAAFDRGLLTPETTVGSVVTDAHPSTRDLTVHQLLTHTGGLPAVPMLQRFFPDPRWIDPAEAERRLLGLPRETTPATDVVYSCTGFQLLGVMLQRVTGWTLTRLFAEWIAAPLGLPTAGLQPQVRFGEAGDWRARSVATEYCPWRDEWVRGYVHDESAYCLDGNAGNAGLFATIAEVLTLTEVWANAGAARPYGAGSGASAAGEAFEAHRGTAPVQLVRPETIGAATRCYTEGMAQRRGRAVQFNTAEAAGGPALSSDSFGHTGFTGCHFWIDPTRELTVVAMCSRLQYGREATLEPIKQFRQELHRAVVTELGCRLRR